MRRNGWSEVAPGVSMENQAITYGPDVTWGHIDGPLLHWAGHIHWLTLKERLRIFFRRADVDQIASEHWPHLATLRRDLNAHAQRSPAGASHNTSPIPSTPAQDIETKP